MAKIPPMTPPAIAPALEPELDDLEEVLMVDGAAEAAMQTVF